MRTQRSLMIEIWNSTNRNVLLASLEYAKAEQIGKVGRKKNINSISAEKYALALVRDGLKKGWLN